MDKTEDYVYEDVVGTVMSDEEMQAQFSAFLSQAREQRLSELIGPVVRGIRDRLADIHGDELRGNGSFDDFSNLLVVAPSKTGKQLYIISSETAGVEDIYVTDEDELYPIMEIIQDGISKNESREAISRRLTEYQDILEARNLTDILERGKYQFSTAPAEYMVRISTSNKPIIKKVDSSNPVLFNALDKYYTAVDKIPYADMIRHEEEFMKSDEYLASYAELKNTYNHLLNRKSLTDDQIDIANRLFVQIPLVDFKEPNEENEFCFDALKTVQAIYNSKPQLSPAWMKLPLEFQKAPQDLNKEIAGKNVKSTNPKMIKTKVENVDKMHPKPEEVVTEKEADETLTDALDNLEKLDDKTKELLRANGEKTWLRAFKDRRKKRKEVTGPNPIIRTAKGGFFINFALYEALRRRFKRGSRIDLSSITGDPKDKGIKITKEKELKIIGDKAKDIKVTEEASNKLNVENPERLEIDEAEIHPTEEIMDDIKKKNSDIEEPEVIEPESLEYNKVEEPVFQEGVIIEKTDKQLDETEKKEDLKEREIPTDRFSFDAEIKKKVETEVAAKKATEEDYNKIWNEEGLAEKVDYVYNGQDVYNVKQEDLFNDKDKTEVKIELPIFMKNHYAEIDAKNAELRDADKRRDEEMEPKRQELIEENRKRSKELQGKKELLLKKREKRQKAAEIAESMSNLTRESVIENLSNLSIEQLDAINAIIAAPAKMQQSSDKEIEAELTYEDNEQTRQR